MTHQAIGSFSLLAFGIAGAVSLLAAAIILGHLARTWLRGPARDGRTVGQEIVWTLIPVLILVGLTLMGEASGSFGRVRSEPAAGVADALTR